ncbi:hypothetical protein FGO68_gene7777 [Halteria grandinella]|uniref:Uncharacterized protein n=1 Tax=Halteria grandinella TaxID=5974 RepID=A0A8J8TAI2_HALGN|nr:hypothetical protein FGO68_gene7777 [Halteria grandinella]
MREGHCTDPEVSKVTSGKMVTPQMGQICKNQRLYPSQNNITNTKMINRSQVEVNLNAPRFNQVMSIQNNSNMAMKLMDLDETPNKEKSGKFRGGNYQGGGALKLDNKNLKSSSKQEQKQEDQSNDLQVSKIRGQREGARANPKTETNIRINEVRTFMAKSELGRNLMHQGDSSLGFGTPVNKNVQGLNNQAIMPIDFQGIAGNESYAVTENAQVPQLMDHEIHQHLGIEGVKHHDMNRRKSYQITSNQQECDVPQGGNSRGNCTSQQDRESQSRNFKKQRTGKKSEKSKFHALYGENKSNAPRRESNQSGNESFSKSMDYGKLEEVKDQLFKLEIKQEVSKIEVGENPIPIIIDTSQDNVRNLIDQIGERGFGVSGMDIYNQSNINQFLACNNESKIQFGFSGSNQQQKYSHPMDAVVSKSGEPLSVPAGGANQSSLMAHNLPNSSSISNHLARNSVLNMRGGAESRQNNQNQLKAIQEENKYQRGAVQESKYAAVPGLSTLDENIDSFCNHEKFDERIFLQVQDSTYIRPITHQKRKNATTHQAFDESALDKIKNQQQCNTGVGVVGPTQHDECQPRRFMHGRNTAVKRRLFAD